MSASMNGDAGSPLVLRETSTAMVAAQAKAGVEARYTMALHRQRDEDQAREKLLRDCGRPTFAASAEYVKPVGGSTIRGASVRLVESAMRAWGNVLTETHTLYDDADKTILRVDVTDLESNNTYSEEITVQKSVERRKRPANADDLLGERKNSYNQTVYIVRATEDDMLTKVGALRSKAIRNMGLRILPGDLIEEALETCRSTNNKQDAADPSAARKRLLDAFREIGVSAAGLKAYAGQSLESLSPAQMGELRAIFQSVKSGETTWREVVESNSDAAAVEKVRTASGPAASVRGFGGKPKHDAETGEVRDGRDPDEDEAAYIRAQELALAGGE